MRFQTNARWKLGSRGWWLASAPWSLVLALTMAVPSVRSEMRAIAPMAEVNGEAITKEDLDRVLGSKLAQLQEQMYSLKRQQLDILIEQKLLAQEAAKRGISVAVLLDAEVTSKVALVTETEIDTVYEANKSHLNGEVSDVRQKIRAALQGQKLAEQRNQFVGQLRSKTTVVDHLQPPSVMRIKVSTDGAPVRGLEEAAVTLIEFSDFHCPFCKRVQPTLQGLLNLYPKQVKLVFRDFPLDNLHPQARGAAQAARCAHEQGKFWEYHDLLFTNAPKASSEDLGKYAEQIGLDGKKFEICLSNGSQQAAVQQDVEEGTRLGITGTPMFFINGRPLSGALPLERFVQVVEEELARSSVAQEEKEPKS